MILELKWLEDYLALCNSKSFRLAAKCRHTSQSAFSRRIKTLETWLGAELFDRSTFPVSLTKAGSDFEPFALQMVQTAYQARQHVRSLLADNNRTLSIATHPSLALSTVPCLITLLEPHIGPTRIKIRNDLREIEHYLIALEQGDCDFLICYQDQASSFAVDGTQFLSHQLSVQTLVPVIAPALIRSSTPTTLPLINYAPYTQLGKIIAHRIERDYKDWHFQTVCEASIAETLKAMVLSGRGLAWLPHTSVQEQIQSQQLQAYPWGLQAIHVEILIYRYINASHPQIQQLWQCIQDAEDIAKDATA